MIRLLLNNASKNHGNLLRSWLPGCDDGFVAVAFLKATGLKQIENELKAFLDRGGSLRMVVGTDFYLTDPQSLRWLLGLAGRYPRFEWRMVEALSGSTFHPKYYRFSGGGHIWMLTGSANMTAGGMGKNVEVSAIAEDGMGGALSGEAKRLEEALWMQKRSLKPTEALIGEYAVRFEVNRKRMDEAAAAVKKTLKERPKLEGEFLNEELAAYRADSKKPGDLAKRRKDYMQARKLIVEELLGTNELDPATFKRVYEDLVGRAGGAKLWSSGGVNRNKNEVIAANDKVVAMLRELKGVLYREPEVVYEVGLRWLKQIRGLGPNIFTEFCHTLDPERFAVMNNNPVDSLEWLGIDRFPEPQVFKPADYGRFCRRLNDLATQCGFSDFGETDLFLDFVYQRRPKTGKAKNAKDASEEENDPDSEQTQTIDAV